MRMYNAEWEAIKSYDYVARYTDVQFDLTGFEIPMDHGHALGVALRQLLPWLDAVNWGLHLIHATPSGRNDNLVLNRRVKLMLRLPVERLADACTLIGKSVDPGAGAIHIGALKEKPLLPFPTLYSPFVANGCPDESGFLECTRAELEKMDIDCGLIPGKRRKMSTPDGDVVGYSLMLHDVNPEQSIRLQENGLGNHHAEGCGIFVPHKSIKEVTVD